MKRFEYQSASVGTIPQMNGYGRQGWEVYHIDTSYKPASIYMKREIGGSALTPTGEDKLIEWEQFGTTLKEAGFNTPWELLDAFVATRKRLRDLEQSLRILVTQPALQTTHDED